jgi:hypothetical protein
VPVAPCEALADVESVAASVASGHGSSLTATAVNISCGALVDGPGAQDVALGVAYVMMA